jgi:hypothetical protein
MLSLRSFSVWGMSGFPQIVADEQCLFRGIALGKLLISWAQYQPLQICRIGCF